MPKQKLSPAAAKRKAATDLRYANSPKRKAHRRDAQKKRRAVVKAGGSVEGKDYDHKRSKMVSVKSNRGNQGNGTKSEGKKKYKVSKKQYT
tara:strand:- start:5467 stop:5739 length:273 start_codon:yes stop_codon:yes gene_type:complete